MDISTIRPRVAELTFQLFERPAHPELFNIYKSHRVEREQYSARLHITSDGHAIVWHSGGDCLSEICSSIHQIVPQQGRVLAIPLRDSASDQVGLTGQLSYRYEVSLERVAAEMFWMIQKQLGESTKNHELIQVFNSSGRTDIGGLSFIHVEARLSSLSVQAIHTFPDDLALVKTQSTFSVK